MIKGGDRGTSAATRLRVLSSLPQRHQDYLFEVVSKLCASYIASLRISMTDREAEALELLSEVMAKLLGVAGVGVDNGRGSEEELPRTELEEAISNDPKCDARITWLVEHIGGWQGLKHRYEDILRRRYGGKWTGDGYPHTQLKPEEIENLSVEPDDPHHDGEMRWAFMGMLAMAESLFTPDDDVLILLAIVANDTAIQDGFFGSVWPISQIVDALNKGAPSRRWDDHRVDNAKKRLNRWVTRLWRTNGGDVDDLVGLFARYGRKQHEEFTQRDETASKLAHSKPIAVTSALSKTGPASSGVGS